MNTESIDNNRPFRILAISGGGFRGLYSICVLEALEKNAGKPLAQCFDLICGTSIGGIISLGLAIEIPTTEIKNLFVEHGTTIFKQSKIPSFFSTLRKYLSLGYLSAKHSNKGLKQVLSAIFSNKSIKDIIELNHLITIPSINYSKGHPQFFKTPHHKDLHSDINLKLVDIALATSAAPTYFPLHYISERGYFIDGGLFGNAPELFGVHEATHYLSKNEEDIHVLSIGTLENRSFASPSINPNKGILNWGSDLFDVTISAQQLSTQFIIRHRLQHRYVNINEAINHSESSYLALDSVSETSTRILKEKAKSSVQNMLLKKEVRDFLSHVPCKPTYYNSTNINC